MIIIMITYLLVKRIGVVMFIIFKLISFLVISFILSTTMTNGHSTLFNPQNFQSKRRPTKHFYDFRVKK